ncbi:hypothetical protein GCM10011612_08700 [Actinomyces gaoshouyii]|uniref:Uncharacterized protein n=1 Tax=Actinomyces gaoshouyii TaxID=1960083 RepID=A0A8H9LIG5_9ACTO|nr:hypothetical protein GCM10011612_08700 [Actinomyces gaoshouyii]
MEGGRQGGGDKAEDEHVVSFREAAGHGAAARSAIVRFCTLSPAAPPSRPVENGNETGPPSIGRGPPNQVA